MKMWFQKPRSRLFAGVAVLAAAAFTLPAPVTHSKYVWEESLEEITLSIQAPEPEQELDGLSEPGLYASAPIVVQEPGSDQEDLEAEFFKPFVYSTFAPGLSADDSLAADPMVPDFSDPLGADTLTPETPAPLDTGLDFSTEEPFVSEPETPDFSTEEPFYSAPVESPNPEETVSEPLEPEQPGPDLSVPEPSAPEDAESDAGTSEPETPDFDTSAPLIPEQTAPEQAAPDFGTADPFAPEQTAPDFSTADPFAPEQTAPDFGTADPFFTEPMTPDFSTADPFA